VARTTGPWRAATLAVGATAAAAIAIGLLLLVNAGTGPGPVEMGTVSISTAAVTQCCRLSASLARGAVESVVTLEAAGSGRSIGCGVVLGNGDLVATTATLGNARRVRAVAATGQALSARVVGTDPGSGVALLELPVTLPPASVGAENDVGAGSPAMAVAMSRATTSTRDKPRPDWTSGTVVSLGTPVPGGGMSGMATIVVRGASVPDVPGEPLIDLDGKVVGILAGSSGQDRVFLPMPLVVQVSDEIDTIGRVRHGWLDLSATTPPGSTGALVMSVEPHGASASVLLPGDVIVSVNGTPVRSSADLRSILYVMAPGATVTVDALRDGRSIRAVVRLSTSP
jgi:S1-C subfamily serine protease